MSKVSELSGSAIDQLNLSPAVTQVLKEIQAEMADAYRESFLQMLAAFNKQASALDRIQNTLEILVRHVAPSIAKQVPAAIRVASADEEPDIASALLVPDPIGAGFTLSATGLAQALGITVNDVGILVKAFKLKSDGNYAVIVRQGGKAPAMVNYHPRTIERFRELMANPPPDLDAAQISALKRVAKRMSSIAPPSSQSAPAAGSSPVESTAPSPPAKQGTDV